MVITGAVRETSNACVALVLPALSVSVAEIV